MNQACSLIFLKRKPLQSARKSTLQGFAIETLSPTTTLLTLLEQSDPKGWTNKTAIPQQMITTLAGIGEFGDQMWRTACGHEISRRKGNRNTL